MRREGHKALVHTAAASNLGQMLNKICIKDWIDLVNIVRDAKQEEILRGLGARHVYNSASPDFAEALTGALIATGATLAFDAIGGGPLANQILTAMEAAITHGAKTYNRYGSNVHKQVYIYGGLDTRPIEIRRAFGAAWGVGGWLVFPYLAKLGPETMERLRQRVSLNSPRHLRAITRARHRWPKRSMSRSSAPTASGPPARNISSIPTRRADILALLDYQVDKTTRFVPAPRPAGIDLGGQSVLGAQSH
jgi:hypothetical protein